MSKPQKFDADKIRLELIPPEFERGIGAVLTFGARKYAAGNWASGEGFEWSRLLGGMKRHLNAWAGGEDLDPESGLSHLYHAGCMLAFLTAHMERGHGIDDRQAIGVKHAPRQPAPPREIQAARPVADCQAEADTRGGSTPRRSVPRVRREPVRPLEEYDW